MHLRPKLAAERNKEWSCCFCLHVRTGTIILGLWHLFLHLLALGVLAAILRDPRLLNELEGDEDLRSGTEEPVQALPTPLSNVDPPTAFSDLNRNRDHSLIYHDVDVGALVTVCTLAITLMLVYGAARGKPAHLLPFFCLQLFDFAITTLTAAGYLCYVRSVHRLVAEARHVPCREQLLRLSAPALAMVVLTAFLAAMVIKAYCIGVVWRCYKYLTMRQHAVRTLSPYVATDGLGAMVDGVAGGEGGSARPAGPRLAPGYSSLLPDYEEALKQAPPPSYQAATAAVVAETLPGTPLPGTPLPGTPLPETSLPGTPHSPDADDPASARTLPRRTPQS